MRALFERDHWANERLLDFCAKQPAEVLTGASGDDVLGPVDVQLPHLIYANPIFITWVTGDRSFNEPAEGRSMHNLVAPMRWTAEKWPGALDFERDPEAHYEYPRRSGPPADMTRWKALLQWLHHGDDHRNQVATVLSRHGVQPPELDLWSFGEALGFERVDTDPGRPEWRDAILRRAFGHHEWATEKLLAACMELSPDQLALTAPGTYGSILDTLDHMISSNRSYLSRLQGTGRKPALQAGALAPLREEFRRTTDGWVGYLDSRPDFEASIDMRDGTRVGAWVIVAQAIHHGNDHRTHVTTTMSHNGLPFPHLDPWEYAVAVDAQPIDVRIEPRGSDGWRAWVNVRQDGTKTEHEVTVSPAELERYGATDPTDLVRRSFEFLLAREPATSILRRFAVGDISHYFPDFEDEIKAPR